MAEGRADVALTGRSARDADLPVPVTSADDALVEAIVVPNMLWRPEDPLGYGGGELRDDPRLEMRRYDESGEAAATMRAGARWTSCPPRRTTSLT